MTSRRSVLLMAGAMLVARAAAAALPVPRGDRLTFRLLRHGTEIGTHALTFEQAGDVLTVRITVDVLVTFASIPLARYTHRGVETWDGTALVEVVGNTDNNGRQQWVRAHRTEEGLVVLGSQTQRYVAPASALTSSYWDKRMLDGPMISLEDGVLLTPKVADLRMDRIRLASGRMIAADHYNLSGTFNVDLWYDETQTWAGMVLTVVDGSEIRYERL
jgi:hypothetical protein